MTDNIWPNKATKPCLIMMLYGGYVHSYFLNSVDLGMMALSCLIPSLPFDEGSIRDLTGYRDLQPFKSQTDMRV